MAYFKRDAKARMEEILLRDSIEATMSTKDIIEYRTKKSVDNLIGQDKTLGYIIFYIALLLGFFLWSSAPLLADIIFLIFLPLSAYFFISGYKKKRKAHASKADIRRRWENAVKKGTHPRVDRQYGYQFTTTFNRIELTGNIKSQSQMDAIDSASLKVPVEISTYDDKTWFYYKDEMWITNDVYNTYDCVVSIKYQSSEGDKDNEELITNITLGKDVPNDPDLTETVQVSEDLKYLIDLEEVKKIKKIETAKNIIEGTGESKSEERSRRISQEVKDRVWNRDNGKCVECGSNENLEFDHIIPFSKGGANTYRNLQLLCEHCNRSKSDKIG